MILEEYREYCLSKTGVTEDFPFDKNVLVFRVGGKIFSLCDVYDFETVNLKCLPEYALELREQYPGIVPGYHMNKKHWNTVSTKGDIPVKLVLALADESYKLVKSSLSKIAREKLG